MFINLGTFELIINKRTILVPIYGIGEKFKIVMPLTIGFARNLLTVSRALPPAKQYVWLREYTLPTELIWNGKQ